MEEDNVVLESIDDFLPMPGADSVVSPDNEKPSFFSNAEETLDFLEEEKEEEDIIPSLTEDIEETKKTPGRKKVDKSGMVEIFSKLIEEKTILPFDGDEKKLEDYSLEDWKELIQENLNERERQIKEQTPKEFFEALPDELKAAAHYVAQGGTDLKGLFKVLSQVEETRSLDPQKEDDQEVIARQYLYATNFGKGDSTLIEEQLEEWMEAGLLEKKAKQFKPKLDEMQQEIIQEKLKLIDHLSADLAGNVRVHTYFNTDLGKHQLKFMRDGSRIKVLDFDTPEDIANFLMDATERTNNARKTVN